MEKQPINVNSFDTDSLNQIVSICRAEIARRVIKGQQETNRIDNEKRDKLMFEKATPLTEDMVIKQLEGVVTHAKPMTELEIIQRSLDEARQAGYTKKVEELEALIADPVNVADRFEEIEKKRPFIM